MGNNKVWVSIKEPIRGREFTMQIPSDVTSMLLINYLMGYLNLPSERDDGHPVIYSLTAETESGSKLLRDDQTLENAGIKNNSTLQLMPNKALLPGNFEKIEINNMLSGFCKSLRIDEGIFGLEQQNKRLYSNNLKLDDGEFNLNNLKLYDGKTYLDNFLQRDDQDDIEKKNVLRKIEKRLGSIEERLDKIENGMSDIHQSLSHQSINFKEEVSKKMQEEIPKTRLTERSDNDILKNVSPERARVSIINGLSGMKFVVNTPINVTAGQLIPYLINSLKLPTNTESESSLSLSIEGEDERQIDNDEILAEAGVKDGSTLIIYRTMTAGCFLPETSISLHDNNILSIKNLKTGDEVLSYDTSSGKFCTSIVKKIVVKYSKSFLIINNKLKITPTHLVYANKKWIRAGNLKCGDCLQDLKGVKIPITNLQNIHNETKVYNLCLSSPAHTFFAEGILVHNFPAKERFANIEVFAYARLDGIKKGDPLFVGKEYLLYTGISKESGDDHINKPLQIPDKEVVELDISVFARDMEISPRWSQKLYYYRNNKSGILVFKLTPKTTGKKQIRIDFYHQRNWLQSLEINVEVVAGDAACIAPGGSNLPAIPLKAAHFKK